MAQWNDMTKHPDHPPANEALPEAADDLEFRVAPHFVPPPPKNNVQVMLRRMAENLPWQSNRPGGPARRRAEKIPVEPGL